MKKKIEFSVVEIIGVIIIIVVLLVIAIPSFNKLFKEYDVENFKLQASTILSSAVTEYEVDINVGNSITRYCYLDTTKNKETLGKGTVRSLNTYNEKGMSYLIDFDEKGNIKEFYVMDKKYSISLKVPQVINDVSIKGITKEEFSVNKEVLKKIEICPYH
ncbi:MAG: hypothetical protein RSB41_01255 [Bacilli bacterium]